MNKIKLIICDGDGLCYHSSKDSLEESLLSLDERIQNIFEKTEATHYVIFISFSPYFRHKIDENYKSNRSKTKSPLKWLKTLKNVLIEKYNAQWMKGVEADDLCAYWMNQDICIDDNGTHFEPRHIFESALEMCKSDGFPTFTFESVEKVLCAVDKDLLQSIPGKHFNYTYKLENKDDPSSVIKGWWVETTKKDAEEFFAMQMIWGDASDNIATPFPENCAIFNKELNLQEILMGYINGLDYRTPTGIVKFKDGFKNIAQGIYEFQKNYRLLHLLDCNEDFMREVDEIPMTPVFTEVIRDSQVENNDEFNVEF